VNARLRAPHLTEENVLSAIRAGDDTRPRLAETFDVHAGSFTLRRLVFALTDRRLIRMVERMGEDDLLVVVS
jgi:hypothetical protein